MAVRYKKTTAAATVAAIAVIFAVLVYSALTGMSSYAALSAFTVLLFIIPFFLSLDMKKPQARDIVPIAVMAAVGAVGRMLFAAVPSLKPTTAIVIISGVVFGPHAGFLTGAVAALVSNLFFGQGAYTPWQMLAWGLCGFLAGFLKKTGLIRGVKSLAVYGFFASILFGLIMNCWHVIGFVNPITWGAVLTVYASSIVFDVIHALSTAVMILLLGNPWIRKLNRIKIKFGILQS